MGTRRTSPRTKRTATSPSSRPILYPLPRPTFAGLKLSIHDKHDDAIAVALRAVELTDQTEETESQGNSRLDLAHVYARAGKIPEAQTAFREARERFERKGIVVLVDDVQQRLDALSE